MDASTNQSPPPPAAVTQWRQRTLMSAGFDNALAAQLAREVDLHALLELVDHGCPPCLAARILAPLESGRP